MWQHRRSVDVEAGEIIADQCAFQFFWNDPEGSVTRVDPPSPPAQDAGRHGAFARRPVSGATEALTEAQHHKLTCIAQAGGFWERDQ